MSLNISYLPAGVLVLLGVLAVAQLALDVVALTDLVRRPRAQIRFGNKWVWAAIIVCINLVGAVLYFAAGREPLVPSTDSTVRYPHEASAASIADQLYGKSGPGRTP